MSDTTTIQRSTPAGGSHSARVRKPHVRRVSDSMRLRSFTRYLAAQPKRAPFTTYVYRGFEISGATGRRWFVGGDPRIFTSKAQAELAVDRCLALRAELGP